MSISGTTNTCQILSNTQFYLSGLSQTNLSTINILDNNGLEVSECFGITTNIITVQGDNVTLTGDCNTSLEINITEGVVNPIECNYTGYTEQQDGLILFEFTDNITSLNIHPDCCLALGHTPEIGPDNYYVCRSIEEIDVTDCDNYSPTYQLDTNGYNVFEFVTGGTVTTVPSAQCCYQYGFVELVTPDGIKCVVEEVYDPCNGLTVVEPLPPFGDITFYNASTNAFTVYVPTAECCTSNGFNYVADGNNFKCFQSNAPKPTVTIINDECCQEGEIITEPTCMTWRADVANNVASGEGLEVQYIDCNGTLRQEEYYNENSTYLFCAEKVLYIDTGSTQINGTEENPIPSAEYSGQWGSITGLNSSCG